jgi:hypothetical protein
MRPRCRQQKSYFRRNEMKSPSMKLLATLVLALSVNLRIAHGQTQIDKEPQKTISVMGCLVKGDEPNEVWLAEKNGTIFGLESSKIELSAHLGHKVI